MLPEICVEDSYQLSEEEELWVTTLHSSLSKIKNFHGAYSVGVIQRIRTILPEEISKLIALTEAGKLICYMGSGNFGFGLSASFFKHPSYPAAQCGVKPTVLITVTTDHFWPEDSKTNEPRKRMDELWDAFSPSFYSETNVRMIEFYRFEKPRPRSDYEY